MKIRIYLIILITFLLVGCQNNQTSSTETTTQVETETCDFTFRESYQELIKIKDIQIPYSDYQGHLEHFISPCDETYQELVFTDSTIKTHQLIINFDAIYPIDSIDIETFEKDDIYSIETIDLFVSLDGVRFNKILDDYSLDSNDTLLLDNILVRSIKITFPNQGLKYGLDRLRFYIGEGMIIKEETEMSEALLRTEGWTGADGIFSFDLDNGGDRIGVDHSVTGFIFSDTFIGGVNPYTNQRISPKIINNSFGYYSHQGEFSADNYSFDYDMVDGLPKSVLLPNAYIGKLARNLLDQDGLSVSFSKEATLTNQDEGVMYLSNHSEPEILIDLQSIYSLSELVIWNYNDETDYGTKKIGLSLSQNGIDFSDNIVLDLPKASGSSEEHYNYLYQFTNTQARYLKLTLLEGYNNEYIGLGKILIFDQNAQALFGQAESTDSVTDITQNEESSRLWLQDGVIIDDQLYLFPILVKDFQSFFKVHNVSMIRMDILDKRFDYQNAAYLSAPLMFTTDDGGVVYFGAGVMDNRDNDGYIYVYGYKDLSGRHLVVSRFKAGDIENFNEWEYYTEAGFVKNSRELATLKDKVSAELSVTYIDSGVFAGKYLLVVMEDTTSGKISLSFSDTPYGDFSEYQFIYQTYEASYLNSAFTYNAKLHPALSSENKWIISYNVNTTSFQALADARTYYPRFISITYIEKSETNE